MGSHKPVVAAGSSLMGLLNIRAGLGTKHFNQHRDSRSNRPNDLAVYLSYIDEVRISKLLPSQAVFIMLSSE